MKKLTAIVLALLMVIAILPGAVLADGFSDTGSSWARYQIERWAARGVLNGYPDGTFGPEDKITRSQVATVIDNIFKFQETSENEFEDLPDAWYTNYMLKAIAAGVYIGDGSGEVRPNAYITRQEAALVLARVFKITAYDLGADVFTDAQDITGWAKGAVGGLKARGYINGFPDGSFRPLESITRAELVTIIDNIIGGFYNKAGDYTDKVDGIIVVNTDGVVLTDMTITGDLYVTPGVGNGEFTLNHSIFNGNAHINGGGVNSIIFKADSVITGTVTVCKSGDGAVRLLLEDGTELETVCVEDGSNDVVITGVLTSLTIGEGVTVKAVGAEVGNVTLEGEESRLDIDENSVINELTVSAKKTELSVAGKITALEITADGTTVTAAETGEISDVTINSDDTVIKGDGKVTNVKVESGGNNAVLTGETNIEVGAEAGMVTTYEGGTIQPGDSETTKPLPVSISKVEITDAATIAVTLAKAPSTEPAEFTLEVNDAALEAAVGYNVSGSGTSYTIVLVTELNPGDTISVSGTGNVTGTAAAAYDTATVSTPEQLTAALSADGFSSIKISGTIGSAGDSGDSYGIYNVTHPVSISGIGDAPTVYGSFVVTADGAAFEGLTISNNYSVGNQSPSKNAINFFGSEITISCCVFEKNAASSSADPNGVFIWPSEADTTFDISGNTFKNYSGNDSGWYSAGLGIAENYPMAQKSFFGALDGDISGNSAALVTIDDEALESGNSYANCAYGYTRQDWSGPWATYTNKYAVIYDGELFTQDLASTENGVIVWSGSGSTSGGTAAAGSKLIVAEGAPIPVVNMEPGAEIELRGDVTVPSSVSIPETRPVLDLTGNYSSGVFTVSSETYAGGEAITAAEADDYNALEALRDAGDEVYLTYRWTPTNDATTSVTVLTLPGDADTAAAIQHITGFDSTQEDKDMYWHLFISSIIAEYSGDSWTLAEPYELTLYLRELDDNGIVLATSTFTVEIFAAA